MSLSEGLYFCKRKAQGVSESKNGNPQIWIQFTATHAAEGEDAKPITPVDRKLYLSLSDAAMPYTTPKLKQLGFNGKFDDSINFAEETFWLEMKLEEYGGKWRDKWDLPYGGSEEKPVDQKTRMAVEAKWKSANATQPGKPAGKPSTPPKKPQPATKPAMAEAATVPAGDDIPF